MLGRVAEAMRIGPGSTFIDLACGLGGPGLWVCERTGAKLVGVDFAGSAVRAATALARQRNIAHASFMEADATQTGLPSDTFDALMSIDAIQFIDPRGAATEIARLLRPGGIAAITTVEALVDDLPFVTVAKDYRTVLSSCGFSIREYEQMTRENEHELFASIEAYRDALLDEIGDAALPLLEEARDRLKRAELPPRVRKIFLVIQKSDHAVKH